MSVNYTSARPIENIQTHTHKYTDMVSNPEPRVAGFETHTHTHTHQFLETLSAFQWTHFPAVIHHIRTQEYPVIEYSSLISSNLIGQ